MKREIVVAVAGNPNVGKSTLFNVLTGELAHVANWPGTTVELKEGYREHAGRRIRFVDLPGTYGISAVSLEEVVAREFIVHGEPDVVLALVDSTAPERTLYLPVQILELTPRVVVALTKMDAAHSLGVHVHVDKLEERLGVPVVPVSAIRGTGIKELLDALVAVAEGRRGRREPLRVDYGPLEPYIAEVEEAIRGSKGLSRYPARWAAVRLLEGDRRLEELLEEAGDHEALRKVREVREALRMALGRDPAELAITARFSLVDRIAREVVVRVRRPTAPSRLERVLEHPLIGPPVGLAIALLVFMSAFALNTGFPLNVALRILGLEAQAEAVEAYSLSGLLGDLFTTLADHSRSLLEAYGAPSWLVSLVSEGLIPGVGSVLTFLPLIAMTFLVLAVLEDSGIAPRIAVSLNTLLNRFGLTGRAVFPMLVSLGCNVPGVMVTRACVEEEERRQLIASTPFIPCQARLIVALAFATAYTTSPLAQGAFVAAVYLVAFLVALATSLLIRRLVYRRQEPPDLILEIPPVHRPSLKVVWWITWDYTKHFLRKAATIILGLSVVTWLMVSYGPAGPAVSVEDSYAAIIGRLAAPLLHAIGVPGDEAWKLGYALVNGLIAKEALVESIAVLHPEATPEQALRALNLTPLQAFTITLLSTLYLPCLATLAVIYQETRSLKQTTLILAYTLTTATTLSLLTYHLAHLAGW